MDDPRRIASLEDVPDETTLLFRVRKQDTELAAKREAKLETESETEAEIGEESGESAETKEAILVRLNGDVAGWLNYCQHLTHIRLDKGSGATMRDGEIICENHGAYFESDSGLCNFGPCEGAYLNSIDVTVDDGDVFLTDPEYEYVGRGGIETDDLDRTSTSNIEF
ncbi:Rieske 2Fe-2S domain-containing protein [Halobacteria archaeon AArc-m2/3/4]|uniref:Rieske 2Fe-2S domain-containing protein n=1 Tax=Natronoglomus mannanivorans TaxID=2979990 RepID=A0AAP2Z0L9_9EURY|nr:Rieske 2Fe-2S domain-containing protein [Halobacteria archaeon AArc-xg1-1]MCU4975158.1 Rieske 2Fe-2S domain-containing protein [Halobacteria archaeon AArc-m2/3/4]